MRILMLGWELPPHNSGGLGVACYHLCKALSKRNIDIEFILPYEADHGIDFMRVTSATPQRVSEIIKAGGAAYQSYKYLMQDGTEEWHDVYSQQYMYEKAVEQLADEREFDIVHAHDWLTFRAALRLKAKNNCPIVLHVHSVESDRAGGQRGNPFVHDIEDLALHMADRVIAVSQHTKNSIVRDYGVPADKIEVIHNSIERDDMEPLDETSAYVYLSMLKAQGYKVVVNIGRLTIQKGLPILLRTAQEVVAREPKTIFLIVGSGELYEELIEQAARLGIARNVIFTDFQRGKRWRDAYAIADLFVLPSISEPFGLTPLEAIGYGTPALVSKQSGVSEVLANCLKVDFWDVNEMANQIVAVVRSDALGRELLANSQREFEKMSWDVPSQKIIKVYEQHLAGAR